MSYFDKTRIDRKSKTDLYEAATYTEICMGNLCLVVEAKQKNRKTYTLDYLKKEDPLKLPYHCVFLEYEKIPTYVSFLRDIDLMTSESQLRRLEIKRERDNKRRRKSDKVLQS